jgi:hypothetical protein
MIRNVEVEVEGVKLNVQCDVYNDRRIRHDSWWFEVKITVDEHDDLTALLKHFSHTEPWGAYDKLMEQIEAQLIEQEDSHG